MDDEDKDKVFAINDDALSTPELKQLAPKFDKKKII